jgi:RNA polymerase sigma factor for flagellar operon FliA
MMLHNSAPHSAEAVSSDAAQSITTRAERQSDLVSRIMLARRSGDALTERLLAAELLVSVRPVIKQVVKVAKRFAGSQAPEDLEQIAAIAVIRTVDKYDPTRGGQSFGEVAYFRARTACEQFARMHASDVHLSDGAHKGRTSRAARGEREAIRVESTDAPVPTGDGSPGRARGGDELEGALRALTGRDGETDNPELLLISAERRARVFEAVRHLAPDRRELVSRVFGINRPAQSVRSVAEAWGAPKSRVDRMLARTLADLRELLVERES